MILVPAALIVVRVENLTFYCNLTMLRDSALGRDDKEIFQKILRCEILYYSYMSLQAQ